MLVGPPRAVWGIEVQALVSYLVRELDRLGVKPVKAGRWSSRAKSEPLVSPRIAGLRVHHGKVIGKASWEPIIDEDIHELLKATIATRGRGLVQPALVRWCNGMLFCGRCGNGLTGTSGGPGRPPSYWCNSRRDGCGKLSILARSTEAEVTRLILDLLKSEAGGFGGAAGTPIARVERPTASPGGEVDRLDIQRSRLALAWAPGTSPTRITTSTERRS